MRSLHGVRASGNKQIWIRIKTTKTQHELQKTEVGLSHEPSRGRATGAQMPDPRLANDIEHPFLNSVQKPFGCSRQSKPFMATLFSSNLILRSSFSKILTSLA